MQKLLLDYIEIPVKCFKQDFSKICAKFCFDLFFASAHSCFFVFIKTKCTDVQCISSFK